jgi:tetratricopeptide (TPR) repeat protein
MLTKKKKLSRKEIKEDKLVSTYYQAQNFIMENKSRLLTYGGILVVVALAVIYYVNHKKEVNQEAGVALSRVIDSYDKGAYLEAIEGKAGTEVIGLKKIVEQYSGTENGETAKIYLANSYNRLGKFDEAFNYYKDYSGDIPMLKAASLAGQAGYYAYKNDFEKAADLFRDAAHVSKYNVDNPDYLLKGAINYINAGKKEQAKELLTTIKKDYKTSTAGREADRYLALVEA